MVAQIFNEIYLKIIILSFLIAIVKGTFDGQRKIQVETKFRDRAELNMKYASNRRAAGFYELWSNIMIWAKVDEDRKLLQPTQLDQMSSQMKKISIENESLKKVIQDQSKEIKALKNDALEKNV